MVGKREQTQTLDFFLILTCLSAGSHSQTSPLERIPKIRARKLSSPYIFVAGALLTSYYNSPSTAERIRVVPSLPLVVSARGTSASACLAHSHTIFRPLLLSQVIFNYHECLGLPIRCLLSALFIHSFIDSISIFYYVTQRISPYTIWWGGDLNFANVFPQGVGEEPTLIYNNVFLCNGEN